MSAQAVPPSVVAATSGTIAALGQSGVFNFSLSDFAYGTAFSILGAVAYQFIQGQAAREAARQSGRPPNEWPRVDLLTVGYAMLGAPLASGLLLYMSHAIGGLSDAMSVGGFMGAGALGPLFIQKVLGLLTKLLGGSK